MDLTNPEKNVIYNMTHEEAVNIVRSGDTEAVRKIDGQFCLVSVDGKTIRMARSIGRPIRYFIAKKAAGPVLIIAERIDAIYDYLKRRDSMISSILPIHGWHLPIILQKLNFLAVLIPIRSTAVFSHLSATGFLPMILNR